jgi:hypothetical protein
MTASEQFTLLDKAAKKSDRWWFLALLMIGMFAVGFLYTDMRNERQEQNLKIEAMHHQIQEKLSGSLIETTRALDRNSAAFEANTALMRRLDDRMLVKP